MQVTVKTLRHYEQKELLIPNEVDEWTGYRYYSIGQMQKLNSIRHLQQLGFTLEEIRDLYDEESHTPSVEQLTEKIKETERQLQRLIARRHQLLEWIDSHKKIKKMEKFTIESLPEVIVASHREVISDYSALGMLCYTVIGPEMQRLGCKCPPPGYCFTIADSTRLNEQAFFFAVGLFFYNAFIPNMNAVVFFIFVSAGRCVIVVSVGNRPFFRITMSASGLRHFWQPIITKKSELSTKFRKARADGRL